MHSARDISTISDKRREARRGMRARKAAARRCGRRALVIRLRGNLCHGRHGTTVSGSAGFFRWNDSNAAIGLSEGSCGVKSAELLLADGSSVS